MVAFAIKTEEVDWAALEKCNVDALAAGSEDAEQQLEDVFELLRRARIGADDPAVTVDRLVHLVQLVQLCAELKDGYLSGAEDQIQQLEETVGIQNDEIRRLHTMVGGDAALELQRFEEERKVYEDKAELAQQRMQDAEEALDLEKRRTHEISEQLRDAKAAAGTLQTQNAQLTGELQQLRNSGAEQRLRERQEEEELGTQLREKAIEVTRLQSDLKYLRGEHSKLQADAANVVVELEATVNEMENMGKEKLELERVLGQNDARMRELVETRDSLAAELASVTEAYNVRVETQRTETEQLESSVSQAVRSSHELRERCEQQAGEIVRLTAEIDALRQEYSESSLDQLRRDLREREALVQSLTLKLDGARADIEQVAAEWEGVQQLVRHNASDKVADAVAKHQQQIAGLQEKLSAHRTREKKVHTRVKSLRRELDRVEQELLDTQQRLHDVTAEVYGLPQALHEVKLLKRQVELRETDVTKWTQRVSDLQAEVDRLREENDAYRELELQNGGGGSSERLEALVAALASQQRRKLRQGGRKKKSSRPHSGGDAAGQQAFEEETVTEEVQETIRRYVDVLGGAQPQTAQPSPAQERPAIPNAFLDGLVAHVERLYANLQAAEQQARDEREQLGREKTLNRFLQITLKDLVGYVSKTENAASNPEDAAHLKSLIEQIEHNAHCFHDVDASLLSAHLSAQATVMGTEQRKLISRVEAVLQHFVQQQQASVNAQSLQAIGELLVAQSDAAFVRSLETGAAAQRTSMAERIRVLRQLQGADAALADSEVALGLVECEHESFRSDLERLEAELAEVRIAAQSVSFAAAQRQLVDRGASAATQPELPAQIRAYNDNRRERHLDGLAHALCLHRLENERLKQCMGQVEQAYIEVVLRIEQRDAESQRVLAEKAEAAQSTVPVADYRLILERLQLATTTASGALERQETLLFRLSDAQEETERLYALVRAHPSTLVERPTLPLTQAMLESLTPAELIHRYRQIDVLNQNLQSRIKLVEGRQALAAEMESRAKARAEDVEKLYLDSVDQNMRIQEEVHRLQLRYTDGATAAEHERALHELRLAQEQARLHQNKVASYQRIADYTMQQLLVTRATRKADEHERTLLRAAVQELQLEDDQKCIIGKLHEQIIVLKVAEATAHEQHRSMTARNLALENQLRRAQLQVTDGLRLVQRTELTTRDVRADLGKVIERYRTLLAGAITQQHYYTLMKKWSATQLASTRVAAEKQVCLSQLQEHRDSAERLEGLLRAKDEALRALERASASPGSDVATELAALLGRHVDFAQMRLDNGRLQRALHAAREQVSAQQSELASVNVALEELERVHLATEAKLHEEREKRAHADPELDKHIDMTIFDSLAKPAAKPAIEIVETIRPDPRVPELLRLSDELQGRLRALELELVGKERQVHDLQLTLKESAAARRPGEAAADSADLRDAQRVRRLQNQLLLERKNMRVARQTIEALQHQLQRQDESTTRLSSDLWHVLQQNGRPRRAVAPLVTSNPAESPVSVPASPALHRERYPTAGLVTIFGAEGA